MSPDESAVAAADRPVWPARWLEAVEWAAPDALPAQDDADWRPLQLHRRAGDQPASDRRTNPGWARMGWTELALVVDFAFVATAAHNRARRLNEPTHLLGDVGEVFLQWLGADRYVELHVTPENQRLQLAWDAAALDRVRRGDATLADFAVADPNWVQLITRVTSALWSARIMVPIATVAPELRSLGPDTPLIAAIGRYDYGAGDAPVLSSTSDFGGRPFHTRAAWHRLRLLPSGAGP